MDCYDALIMTVSENDGSLHDHTAVQSLGYLYTQKMGSFEARYEPYFYGPYSDDVASALIDLSAFSFVNEMVYAGPYGGYTYDITKRGRRYADRVSQELPDERRPIGEILEVCRKNCELKPESFSCAAKCRHILSRKEGRSVDHIKKAGKDLYWNMSDHDVSVGMDLLRDLSLDD